jgi:hypothetical protein
VLPDGALIALNEEAISVSLVIVTTLVLLVAADASGDFIFGITAVHGFFVVGRWRVGLVIEFTCAASSVKVLMRVVVVVSAAARG